MINFYSGQHGYYCGVDLHMKSMCFVVVNQRGETLLHKNIRTRPDDFLFSIAPTHVLNRGLAVRSPLDS